MSRSQRVLPLIIMYVVLSAIVSSAQTTTLLIRSPSSQLLPDGQTVIVELDVRNDGTITTPPTTVRLFDSRGIEVSSAPLPGLEPAMRQHVILTTSTAQFAPGTRPTLYITVGLDSLPGGARTGRGDIASISVSIPAMPDPLVGVGGEQTAESTGSLPIDLPFELNLNDPIQIALAVGIVGLCLVLLWVIWVIVRLVTSRPEPFGVWQPMYPPPPVIDPNTMEGRRYLWQQHAQNDTLMLPCSPGNIGARKQLVGQDGEKFTGWRVVGIRAGRYDQYGRIARTHHTLSSRVVGRLDRAARKRRLNEKGAIRAARPIAKAIVKDILKHSDKRSALLPVALDIRFKGAGKQDRARVAFDLWKCAGNGWQIIDSWMALPTYTSSNEAIEQFGYSYFGQRHGEQKRVFQKRLEQDLTRTLAMLVFKPGRPALEDTAGHKPVTVEAPPTVKQEAVQLAEEQSEAEDEDQIG